MQLADIQLLLKSEIELIEQVDLLECIQQHLIEPRCEKREWDYGEQGQAYPCWICLEDQDSNSAVAYCAEGFGPADPWGLLFLNGKHTSMGGRNTIFHLTGRGNTLNGNGSVRFLSCLPNFNWVRLMWVSSAPIINVGTMGDWLSRAIRTKPLLNS